MARAAPDNTIPSLAQASWLQASETQHVFKALVDQGFDARAVGGAVRNSLLGEPVDDVDIATTATPTQILDAAQKAGLKAVATGFDHGTITVIAASTPFEVTTLRQDIETDGRHARVRFTDDWHADARRRDFTINALYCDRDGQVFDPVNGHSDIKAHIVRFIGDPDERIQEDVLRILRFFRFTAKYGDGHCEPNGLAACRKLRSGLDQLAGERINAELSKLLVAPHAPAVTYAMDDAQILARLFHPVCNIDQLRHLAAIDTSRGLAPDPVQRLAALVGHKKADAVWLRDRLRLSSRAFERLALMANRQALKDLDTTEAAKAYLYHHGSEAYRDAVKIAWAAAAAPANDPVWVERLALPNRWQPPQFPVTGADILARGVSPGPRVGRILAEMEAWWIANDYGDERAKIDAKLTELVTVTKS